MYKKRTITRLKNLLKALRNCTNPYDACKAAGIDYVTLWRWGKQLPSLGERLDEIRTVRVENALFLNALGGQILGHKKKYKQGKLVEEHVTYSKADTGAQCFYLSNRAPDRWKNNRDKFVTPKDDELTNAEFTILTDTQKKEADKLLKEFTQ